MGALASKPPNPCASSGGLALKYAEMGRSFASSGFNQAALAKSALSFVDGRPRRYSEPPWALPPNAVRVLALPLDDSALADAPARRLAGLALQAARELAGVLQQHGAEAWLPSAGRLHVTVFHSGVYPPSVSDGTQTPRDVVAPDSQALREELEVARRLAHNVPLNISMVVDRLVVMPSGVLLLLLRPEADGAPACVDSLRTAAAEAFHGAARKQTNGLLHASLLRVPHPPPRAEFFGPNASVAHEVGELVERWSARLRGLRARMGGLLYVRESQIITLDGHMHRLRFDSGGWAPRRLFGRRALAAHQGAQVLAAAGGEGTGEDSQGGQGAPSSEPWAVAPFYRIGVEEDSVAP
eukprot:7386106-Prymnesium_polylepis.2